MLVTVGWRAIAYASPLVSRRLRSHPERRTVLTVEAYHREPPWAVGTASAFNLEAMASRVLP